MSLKQLFGLIKDDFLRRGGFSISDIFFVPGAKYIFHHRICYYLSTHKWMRPLFVLYWMYMKHLTYLFGIQTDWSFNLPKGITIYHFGGITFFPEKCGENVIIRQGVTVGNNGKSPKNPTIGNNVEFGANSMVLGDVHIGDNVLIAAGAIVTHNVPDNAIVAGIPAKIIRYKN